MKIKLSRLAILALFAKKDEGKFFTHVTADKQLLMISPSLMSMCKDNLIKSIEFVNTGEGITTKDGTKLETFKVVAETIEESNMQLIEIAATIKRNNLTQEEVRGAKEFI